jgi:cell division protease FtsH
MMGAERASMVMSEKEKELTAYHEAGHAIVGRLLPAHDPVYKVSIIPRGRALGVTMFLPTEDKYSNSKLQLESQISTLYGGRIAEEMIYGADAVTTGASNDIERATEIAQSMVTKWGLSDHMGPLAYGVEDNGGFLGQGGSNSKAVSDVTAKQIDEDVRALINRNYQRAEKLLTDHNEHLHTMAKLLMKYETIDSDQIDAIMDGREPGEPKGWNDDKSSSTPPSSPEASDDSEAPSEPADLLH